MIREPDPSDAATEPAPEGQLAKVLDYLAFVAKNRPLTVLLEEAPRRIADCIGADVASLYLMEGDGRSLVLRGNVGLPSWARGKVRLQVGEGITGRAVELRHPIAVSRAADHASYREFPDLEETRFPAFLAVPIMGTAGPLGAFVVQREEGAFSEQEICLVTALTAPISSGLRLARLLDDLRVRPRKGRGGTQRLTLTGVPLVRGRAMGAVAAVRRPTGNDPSASGSSGVERLDAAAEQVERALERLRRDHPQLTADQSSFLDSLDLMVQDQHLKRTARDQIESGATVAEALGAIARAATRAAEEKGDAFLIRRAQSLEGFCDTLLMLAAPTTRAALPTKAIVVADDLGVYDLFVTARTRPVGFVLTKPPADVATTLVLEVLGVPAVSEVSGAFRWLSPGDIAILDADHGLLLVNPTRADIGAHRRRTKREQRSSPGQSSAEIKKDER